jgi:hypothetical protein
MTECFNINQNTD